VEEAQCTKKSALCLYGMFRMVREHGDCRWIPPVASVFWLLKVSWKAFEKKWLGFSV